MKKILSLLLLVTSLLHGDNPDSLIATSAILMDHSTGRILFEKESDLPFPPASMTKLVTLYLTYQAIDQGLFQKDDIVEITSTGSSFSRPPRSSLMMLEEGQVVDLLTIMRGVAVSSGNDAAYQLAELVGGDVESFIKSMNRLMSDLELEHMSFVDPDGWSELNQVTAREYALFASEYIKSYPEALNELHSMPVLSYPLPENFPASNGRILWTREKRNTNNLLGEVEGVDGLKTGYIDESGFNFASTAKRGDTRLITVVMGIFTDSFRKGIELRAIESSILLEYGFSNWKTTEVPWIDETQIIWFGEKDEITIRPSERPLLTLTSLERDSLWTKVELDGPIRAPVGLGEYCGTVQWYLNAELVAESSLVTAEPMNRGSIIENLVDVFSIMVYKVSSGRIP